MNLIKRWSSLLKKMVLNISFITILSFMIITSSVLADPVLNVSISPDLVLLGGQASYTITVTNTDANDKGYNLSFSSVFSSSRNNPQGQVVFHSASDNRGELAPSSSVTDSVTGDTTIEFLNIKDLSPNETYTFTLTVDMSGDATWEAMDNLVHNITATVNTMLDGSGSDVQGTVSNTSDVLPIALVDKIVHQSTGVEQATGTIDRPYEYEIDVQNNYTNATDSVVVTDTLPDGIEYFGVTSGHSCTDTRDNATGITTIVCNLGTMAAGAHEEIHFNAGIRYDYFGTNNGGTNRIHDDFDGTPATGTPIPDKTVLINHVDLNAQYQGSAITTQSDDVPVTAAYATISKSANISDGGNGDTVNYTLTYTTSEYYNIIDDNTDDNSSSITIHDLLPDGQTYISGSASPTPTNAIAENGDGTTDLYWNASVLNALAHSSSFNITFSATIDSTWNNGTQIVAADRMTNTVDSHGEWDDQVDTGRANAMTDSGASAGFGMETPQITKEVEDPNNPGTWIDATDAVVGDTMRFRVRFNTNDGANPIISNVNLGNIVVTDWLPPGMSYNNDAVETYSASGDFTDGGDPDTESAVTIGSLNGVEWTLGDIGQGGWWQAIFTAKVDDSSSVTEGAEVNNIWKMTGENSVSQAYSDRDMVAISYHEPHLVLSKDITSVPNPLKPGDTIEYTVTINNTGQATAKDILFKDTVDDFMNDATPTVSSITLNGTALTEGTDYTSPTFNSGTREFVIDFNDGAIETNIAAGGTLIIVYQVTVDSDAGAGQSLDNIATVSYDTQKDGSGRIVAGTANINDDNTDNALTQLSNLTTTKNSSAGPYAIGEIITYNIDVTVPQGQIAYWPKLEDIFDMDGISYIAGSASLTNVSGTPVTGAVFDASTNPDPIITTAGSDRTSLLWNLVNPIDNRGQATDYVFRLSFNVRYTGLEDNGTDWEFFPSTVNDQVNNTATVSWADYPVGARTTNHDVDTNTVTVDIDQPLLSTTKTITSAGPYTAGGTIDYRIVITNIGDGIAYNITLNDDISQFINNPSITSITHSDDGVLTSGVGYTADFTSDPLSISFDNATVNLEQNETITILYSATIDSPIGTGANILNTADVNWESENSKRVYNDIKDSNYLADTSSADISIDNITMTKTTSLGTGQATVGEEFNYIITTNIPSGTTSYNTEVRDIVPDGLTVIGTTLSPNIGTVTAVEQANGTTVVIWDVGDVTSPVVTQLVLTINVRVDDEYITGVKVDGLPNVADGDIQDILTNNGVVNWDDVDAGGDNHTLDDHIDITIIEPNPTITKSVDHSTASMGDTRRYTVVLSNTNGTAPLYNIDFTDTIPTDLFNSGVSPTLVSVTHSDNGILTGSGTDFTDNMGVNPITIDFNQNINIAPGETITIVYDVVVDNTVASGVVLTNNAEFTGNSELLVDNADNNARDYSGDGNVNITVALTGIGDKVWFDYDADGNQDAGEPGVSGVIVHLLASDGITPVKDPVNPTVDYVIQTDVNGNYNFVNLSTGDYKVKFDIPTGYLFTSKDQVGDDNLDSDVDNTGLSNTVSIVPGGHISNLDAGIIGTSVGDMVWDDKDGNGMQNIGENGGEVGIAGVIVKLLDENGNSVDNPLHTGIPYEVITDANGYYLFQNLPAGNYIVEFVKPTGFQTTPIKNVGNYKYDSDIDITSTKTDMFTLNAGINNTTIDAGFYQPASIFGNIWSDDNKDGIKNINEIENIPNIIINLLDGSGNPVNNPLTGQPYVVVSDNDGNYSFENLLSGNYQVEFEFTTDFYYISPQNVGGDDTVDSDMDPITFVTETVTLNPGDTLMNNDAGVKKKSFGSSGSRSKPREYNCKDSRALNFSNTGIHKQSLCKYKQDIKENEKNEGKEEQVEKTEDYKKKEGKLESKKELLEKKDCGRYLTTTISVKNNDLIEVKKLQEFLNEFENANLDVDGKYGIKTISAVNRYQRKYFRDILYPWRYTKPTSTVISTMRGHINKRYRVANKCEEEFSCSNRFSKYLKLGNAGNEVEKVQSFLKKLGFYKDKIDGKYGPITKKAVRDFQNENYIEVLKPWGIPCICGTGYWYQTTMNFANRLIGCERPLPKLKHGSKPLQCVVDHFPGVFGR